MGPISWPATAKSAIMSAAFSTVTKFEFVTAMHEFGYDPERTWLNVRFESAIRSLTPTARELSHTIYPLSAEIRPRRYVPVAWEQGERATTRRS